MFEIGCWPTIMKLMLESADSEQLSADSSADPAKIGVWVLAFSLNP